ncbi:MAG TPA: EAL domain-containing protein [Candidatus Limnocylindria bacterium]|nr:EAL domain-containing protein [Candidatus Limnocylindria bacterium]
MSETGEPNDVYWVERQALEESGFDLEAALRSDLIEIWYQPKIDLKHKRLIGVEAFARFRSPDGRVIPAGELIKGASSSSIVKLTEKALISALKTSVNLCEIGVDVHLAINVSVTALNKLPIAEIVRKYRPQGGKCLGLVFDVSESQVLHNVEEIVEISGQLRRCGFSVAVDDFGSSVLSALGQKDVWDSRIERTFEAIANLRNVEFSELKLDRALVRDCGTDDRRKAICKHIIDLAHSLGSAAVGVGIERQAELKTLQELQCDVGQGYLFGRPMSEERFLMLLWDRGIRAKQKPKAA